MRIMFNEARNNRLKSWLLMLSFVVMTGVIGAAIGIVNGSIYLGLFVSVLFSVLYSLIVFYSGDSIILNMSGARQATKREYPYLYHTIEGLAVSAGIPAPKAYVIDDSALNAFATGRNPNNASITVTTGLLKTMNRQELEGVVAHEMSHIKSYDIRFMMLAAVLVGVVTLLSDFLLRSFLWGGKDGRDSKTDGRLGSILIVIGLILAVLSPVAGVLINMAISRKREFMADANAAVLTRYPPGLASALRKIAKDPDPLVDKANKATAHLFISTPFRENRDFVTKLFSTHPPIGERIRRLEEM